MYSINIEMSGLLLVYKKKGMGYRDKSNKFHNVNFSG